MSLRKIKDTIQIEIEGLFAELEACEFTNDYKNYEKTLIKIKSVSKILNVNLEITETKISLNMENK